MFLLLTKPVQGIFTFVVSFVTGKYFFTQKSWC